MMQHPMDVSHLLRQMQMNMMMPSLVLPQSVGMPATMPTMQDVNLPARPVAQSSAGPALSMSVPVQSQSVLSPSHGAPLDQGGSHAGDQMVSAMDQGGSQQTYVGENRRGRRRDRRRDSRSDSRSRSIRRSRRSRRRRESRRSRVSASSENELDVESIRLNASHYLTRDYAKCDNIPSSCLMIRKLPRVQLSALIESMHEPWDAAVTSNLSVGGLCQLIYLMTLTIQPWTRIADLRVEFKYKKLLKRCVNAFNAVKMEQTHWNRVCTMIGNGTALLTEESLNACALQLGWQPTWMTETQNNTRRVAVPATEHGAMRAFVRPVSSNVEAAGIPVPQFRTQQVQGGSLHPERDEGGSPSPPPVRIRRRIIPPRAIIHANQSNMLPAGVINVEPEAEPASVARAAPASFEGARPVNPVAPALEASTPAAPAVNPVAPAVEVAAPAAPAVNPAEVPMNPVAPEAGVSEASPVAEITAPVAAAAEAEAPEAPAENPAPVAAAEADVPEAPAPPSGEVEDDGGFEAIPPLEEPAPPRLVQNVELCAFCQCPNVQDDAHGPMVKLNCPHSFHRDCLQEWMDSGDLSFEDACPMRCHLGLNRMV